MTVIIVEKESMAAKISGALDCVRLKDGKTYQFGELEKNNEAIAGDRNGLSLNN